MTCKTKFRAINANPVGSGACRFKRVASYEIIRSSRFFANVPRFTNSKLCKLEGSRCACRDSRSHSRLPHFFFFFFPSNRIVCSRKLLNSFMISRKQRNAFQTKDRRNRILETLAKSSAILPFVFANAFQKVLNVPRRRVE